MGADLIGVVLTIDRDKKPDWEAAYRWSGNLSEDDLFGDRIEVAFDQFAPFEEEYAVGENPADMSKDKREEVAADRESAIRTAINIAKETYEGGFRNQMDFYVRGAYVWIMAEMSWGDMPEEYDWLWFFINNGGAEAAGFDGV